MKRIFTWLLLSALAFTYAQTGTLKGRVVDSEQLPMAGADLMVVETADVAYSDNNGFFDFKKMAAGNYELEINYFGFESKKIPFTITENKVTEISVIMQEGVDLEAVQVVGSLSGTSKALNQQRNMVNVGNVISAEQVDQFPDDNIGDALKRVSGVNVQYDQGEARFGNIRGTAPDLSSVTMDGNRLPSAEGEERAVQLDLIPADMIQSIEVNKVVLPDMDGDAIGASVNMVTRSVPESRRIRVDLSGGYNTIAEKANYKGSLLLADRFFGKKLGVAVSASMFNNYIDSDNIEMEWDKDGGQNDETYTTDYQIREYQLQRLRQNYSAAFDFKFNANHRVEAKAMYNQRDDWENRYRLRFKDIEWDDSEGSYLSEIRRETKGGTNKNKRLEKQKLMNFTAKGEHDFNFMKMDWSYAFAKANEERPNERYITYRNKDVLVSPNFSDTEDVVISAPNGGATLGSDFSFKELTEEFKWTEEKDQTARLDLKFPLNTGKYKNSLKVGAKFRFKEKERNNTFREYEPTDEDAFDALALANTEDMTQSNFQATDSPIGSFITSSFLGGLDLNNGFDSEINYEELAGNYSASEDVYAYYLRFDQKIGNKLKVIAGLRLEQTKIEYNGFVYEEEDATTGDPTLTPTGTQNRDFTNWMPSLLLKYSPSKLWNIKFGVTNTIARPKYFDLVPYQVILSSDNEISIGNPDLSPTKSLNIDLMGEKYFQGIGLIEAGIFYKDISDFIVDERYENYAYNGNTWDLFQRPINGGDATLIGVELGIQKRLDFLPTLFHNFSVHSNYTYTHSDVTNFNIEGREDDDVGLTGTPTHTINASLAYDSEKFEARLSYNHASDFVDEYGDEAFKDRYYDAVDYLDFNATYNFSKKFNIYTKINNILNQPLRYFQGSSRYTMQAEYYGIKYKLGVQYNF